MSVEEKIKKLIEIGILKEDAKLECDGDGGKGVHERFINLDLCAPNTCGCSDDIYLYFN